MTREQSDNMGGTSAITTWHIGRHCLAAVGAEHAFYSDQTPRLVVPKGFQYDEYCKLVPYGQE